MLRTRDANLHKTLRTSFGTAAKVTKAKSKTPSPLTLRLSTEERDSLKLRAGESGLSVSAYVRSCLFQNSGQRKNYPIKDRVELARLLGLLGQSEIATNLDTLADEASCGSLLFDEDTLAKIQAAYDHVCFMRECLIAVLGLRETQDK